MAARQHQAVARQQGLELGFPEATLDALFLRQGWPILHAGVRGVPGSESTPLRAVSAALLAAHPLAAATGRTGLWLLGHLAEPDDVPVVVTPMTETVPRSLQGARVIASRTFRPVKDVMIARRVRVAIAERCLVDRCATPRPTLSTLIDELLVLLQRRAITIPRLTRQVELAKGYPGLGLLERAFADATATGADSPFTRRVHQRLVREGFDPDPFPTPVPTPRRTLHPDITFNRRRGKKAGIECDGLAFHGSHTAQTIDHRKDRAYREVDWICERIGWHEFNHGWEGFARDLHRTLARAEAATS